MSKIIRKTFLYIVSAIAVICFGCSLTLGVNAYVKASTALEVTSVTQVHMEPYNSSADGLGQRGEFVVTFNQPVFTDAISIGEDVTSNSEIVNLLDTVTVNNVKMNAHVGTAFKAFKYSNNAIRFMNDRCILYTEFKFPAGLTLNGYTIASEVTWYQNSDWTFDTTADDYMIKGIYEVPDGSQSTYAHLCVFLNKADAMDNATQYSKVLFNGEQIAAEDGVADSTKFKTYASDGKQLLDWGNDWDAGTSQMQHRIKIAYTALEGGYAEITFKAGFTLGNYTLTKDQTFVRTYGNGIGNPGWDKEPIWVEATNKIEVEQINRLENTGNKANFSIKLNYSSDLFVNYNVGDDLTAWFNSRATELFSNMRIDNTPLTNIHNSNPIKITKLDANTINLCVEGFSSNSTIMVQKGLRIGGAMVFDTASYIEQPDKTFLKFDTSSANKIEVNVTGMKYYSNYGMQSLTRGQSAYYDEKKLETRVAIFFDDLGMFSQTPAGTDISIYCTDPTFTDNLLINGSTLTSIATNSNVIISVYKGVKGEWYYNNAQEDLTNAIEIVLERVAIFDYDVEVKEGFIIGDVITSEDVEYRLDFNQEFQLETPSDKIKPISIREVPYGSDGNVSRAIRFVFNERVNIASGASILDYVTFNGNKISSADTSFLKVTGGLYFNPEPEFNSRYYSINILKEHWHEFLVSDDPTIVVGEIPLSDGTSTEEVTFKMKNGQFTPTTDSKEYVAPSLVAIAHPGNQENDLKYIRFGFSTGTNHYLTGSFMSENLYVNGIRAYSLPYGSSYNNPEDNWQCKEFALWISDNLRNYNGGIDVVYIPKGLPMGGGAIIPVDTYFYGVQDKNNRDGAGNWKWTYQADKPALNILEGGAVTVGDNIVMNITFDRNVAKNDVTLGVYNDVDVSAFIKVNGSAISEISGASYSWVDDGNSISVSVPSSAIVGNIASLTFEQDFVTPLGYEFDGVKKFEYSFNDKVWGNDLSTVDPGRIERTSISEVSALTKINGGYKFSFTYASDIAGAMKVEGSSNYHTWMRNITAEYADLITMTAYSYQSKPGYYGYEYHDYVIENLVKYGVRQSVLDCIYFNDDSLGEILAKETNLVALENYPIQVDFNKNQLIVYVYEDSILYSSIKDGLVVKFVGSTRNEDTSINFGLKFETGKYQSEDQLYLLEGTAFKSTSADSLPKGIVASTTKNEYLIGENLDISTINLRYRLANGSLGDFIEVTEDMISGFDNQTAGRQSLTITFGDYETTLFVTVKEPEKPVVPSENGSKCNASFGGSDFAVIFISLSLFGLALILRKKEKHD